MLILVLKCYAPEKNLLGYFCLLFVLGVFVVAAAAVVFLTTETVFGEVVE